MRKRVTIVFEETDQKSVHEGQGFNVFLEGAERTKVVPEAGWTAAEFWGVRMFQIVTDLLAKSGALASVTKKGGS